MVLVALLLAACEESSAGPGEQASEELRALTLQTDQVEYTAAPLGDGSYRFLVVARLTNRTVRPLQLGRCYPHSAYPVYGVEVIDSDQQAAYDPMWACVGHGNQIVVGSGATRTDSLQVTGPNIWDGLTPLGTLTGRFRLVYRVGGSEGKITSNDFEVRLTP
jgi:hypothetical protein